LWRDVYRIQDVCIVLAIIVVFLLFFNTYIFQAGLVNILISKFKWPILIVLVYLGLTIGLHVWGLVSVIVSLYWSAVRAACNIVLNDEL